MRKHNPTRRWPIADLRSLAVDVRAKVFRTYTGYWYIHYHKETAIIRRSERAALVAFAYHFGKDADGVRFNA
jgi:hypothetical protein